MLRQLGSYYYKDPTLLLLVRVAQGLVHLGKGLLTLAPAHADNQLLSGVGLGFSLRLSPEPPDLQHQADQVSGHGPPDPGPCPHRQPATVRCGPGVQFAFAP